MDLRDYIRVLRRHWLLIVAAVVVGGGAAGAFSALQAPVYQATSKVFVSLNSANSVQELTAGGTYAEQAVTSYANLVTTDKVLTPVIQQLGLRTTPQALSGEISATIPVNTVVIDISVNDRSARSAAAIANAVASQLSTVVGRLTQAQTPLAAAGTGTIAVSPVNEAVVPTSPVSPRVPINLALGLLVGLALGLAFSFLHDRLDARVRSQHDVESLTDRPVVGGIVWDSRASKERLIMRDAPMSARAEAFRALRTNLQFLDFGSHGRAFVITSSVENEGKSTTAANLGLAIADTGQRVLVVDADLRKPKLSEYLGIDGGIGLTDVLVGRVSLDAAVQRWGDGTLAVLPAGEIPPNPSELLGGAAMARLLDQLHEQYDTVLFDAPPLLPVTDAAVLAHLTSGALVVTAARRAKRAHLAMALSILRRVDAKVLGIVLTMVPTKGADAYGRYGYAREDGAQVAASENLRPVPNQAMRSLEV